MDDLDVTRIRAYAATPALMPAARYSGREDLSVFNIEILRLTLANGAEGVSSCEGGWGGAQGGDVVRNLGRISDRILGENVTHRVALTDSLLADAGEGPWEEISLIDCAMWDAYARSIGKPLWQLLGGHRDRVEAYASTVAYLTIDEYLSDAKRCTELGYRAIKFHMKADLDFDLEMVRAVTAQHRESDLRFMVDLEECYTFDEAIRLGEVLSDLPFDWMEAPLPDRDLEAYIELNKAVGIDVLPAGNTLVGPEHWTKGLRSGAWSRLRSDAINAGGVSGMVKAIELAQSMQVPVELQSFGFQPAQHVNLHLMLGLPGCTWFEHPVPAAAFEYATHNPLQLDSEGCVQAAKGPGLGLEINWDLIESDAFTTFDSFDVDP